MQVFLSSSLSDRLVDSHVRLPSLSSTNLGANDFVDRVQMGRVEKRPEKSF